MKRITTRRLGSGISVALISLVLTVGLAAPAGATDGDQDCVLYIDDDVLVCVPSGEDLDAAFTAETGLVRVPSGTEVSGRGPLVVFDLVTYYGNNSYTGTSFTITRSTACNGITLSSVPNLVTYGLNDAISSFQTYGTCTARLYVDPSYGGATFGYTTSQTSLPTFNDVASSTRAR